MEASLFVESFVDVFWPKKERKKEKTCFTLKQTFVTSGTGVMAGLESDSDVLFDSRVKIKHPQLELCFQNTLLKSLAS